MRAIAFAVGWLLVLLGGGGLISLLLTSRYDWVELVLTSTIALLGLALLQRRHRSTATADTDVPDAHTSNEPAAPEERSRASGRRFVALGVLLGLALGLGIGLATAYYMTTRDRNVEALATTTTSVPATSTTSPATTTTLSMLPWRVVNEAAAAAWAEDAVGYMETVGWTFENRDTGIETWAGRVTVICRALAFGQPGDEIFQVSSLPSPLGFGSGAEVPPVRLTVDQVEAQVRERLGIQRWEAYGPAVFESAVSLCRAR